MPRYLLIAGIDFGTSCSKIVIRDKNTPTAPAAVFHHSSFRDGLIPSLVGLDGEEIVPLAGPVPDMAVPYLKMVAAWVAENGTVSGSGVTVPRRVWRMAADGLSERMVVRGLLAAYFAHLTAGVRDFIRLHSRWKDFDFSSSGSKDALIYQLSVPTGLLDKGAKAERLFREALIAACELRSEITSPFAQRVNAKEWISAVNEVLDLPREDLEEKHKWQALVYPEVAAAVQPFFRSPNAKDGLYITVDVGAGTVDCNAFRRRPPRGGPRKIDYYAAGVAPLGVQHLKDPHHAVRQRSERELFRDFEKAIQALLAFAFTRQPNNRYNDFESTWDDAQLFIFGGGAKHPGYASAFRNAMDASRHANGVRDPRVRSLPPPADLRLPAASVDFGRFAVAYGMSYFRPDLDTIRLPNQISSFRRAFPRTETQDWDD
jgi:hypothetical protein